MYWRASLSAIVCVISLGLLPGLLAAQQPDPKAMERDKALFQAARDQYEARWKEYVAGKTTVDFLLPWSANWLKAELKLLDTKEAKVAAHKAHVERLKEVEKVSKAKFEAGVIPTTQYVQTTYYRIEAEILLDEFLTKR